MSTLGTRLKEIRKNQKLIQGEVASTLGLKRVTLSNYERGYRRPDVDTLNKLAGFYGVTTDWLLRIADQPDNEHRNYSNRDTSNRIFKSYRIQQRMMVKRHIKAPVIRDLQSYLNGFAKVNTEEYLYIEQNKLTLNSEDKVFFWQVSSDNMKPLLFSGDYILVKQQEKLNSGDLGLFLVKGEPFNSRIHKVRDYAVLVSSNQEYASFKVKLQELVTVGKIISSLRYY